MHYTVRPMVQSDLNRVIEIYSEGIATGNATFQTSAPSITDWDSAHLIDHRYVAVASDGTICGWIALSPTSSRCVYKGVCEVSIYIGQNYQGYGIGTTLMEMVIKSSEATGIWTLYSAIISTNIGSLSLHKKCGFREIGYRERIAKDKNGKWQDTILMERRSHVVGID